MQRIHDTTEYGANKKSVKESLEDQKQRLNLVKDYKSDVDKVKKVKSSEFNGVSSKVDFMSKFHHAMFCFFYRSKMEKKWKKNTKH